MPDELKSGEIVIAPGGTLWVAAVGTVVPADESATPAGGWRELGYASEDGVTFRSSQSLFGIPAWQARRPVRRGVESVTTQIEFVLRQWNKDTLPLAYGGGAVSVVSAGHYKFAPPGNSAGPDYRSMMVDWEDEGRTFRLVIVKAVLGDQVESQLQRTVAADLPLVFEVDDVDAGDAWYLLTDDVAAFS